ncbi:MAG: hypothetical protein J2P57_03250 [Acidimicrobiaceae bacterium]|nr:hypothetical protein [Acidimicrobiaceae bacterium]
MPELLETAVAAHGGLDRWNDVRSITVRASITGAVWPVKGHVDALREVRFDVDTTRQHLTMEYVGHNRVSVFEPHRVVVQTGGGEVVGARDDPEKSFAGHQFETPWDDLHLAYFTGEALWTYLNTPFLYTRPGFVTDEIAPIEVGGETWRRLEVTFPEDIKTHSRKQVFCFGPDGLLRRHDFTIDVIAGAPAELFAAEYRDVDGIVVPTKRRAYGAPVNDDLTSGPLMVGIDMGEISLR